MTTRHTFYPKQIEEMKVLYTEHLLSLREIGRKFSVTDYIVGRILIGEGIHLRPNGKRTEMICKRCGIRKPRIDFFKDAVCKKCRSIHNREIGYAYQKYNMTYGDYLIIYDKQNGNCVICGEHRDLLFVDHDHSSGRVRGLLCGNCNRLLGMANDNPKILEQAKIYLEKQQ